MSEKNFEFYQKESTLSYDMLDIITKPTICTVDNNIGTNADIAMANIGKLITEINIVIVKVVDQQNRPIKGALVKGLKLNVYTNENGVASGELDSNDTITVESPYVDLKDGSKIIPEITDIFHPIKIVLQSIDDNSILTYTTSKTIEFSQAVDTIDICCVGGGGAGSAPVTTSTTSVGSGGGGGGIVNKISYIPSSTTTYRLTVGAGGTYPAGGGGATLFGNIVVANGGGGGVTASGKTEASGGAAGVSGCGDGGKSANGGSNTTISRFNDGATFYSGGGGGGRIASSDIDPITPYDGGSPNGADGAATKNVRNSTTINATTPGIGGGGGGGCYYKYAMPTTGSGSSGGSGAIFIRVHLK